jgi:hypothetical protein
MKLATPLSRGLLSYLPSVFAMSLGIVATGLSGQAYALSVDNAHVLLVDIAATSVPNLANSQDEGSNIVTVSEPVTSLGLLPAIGLVLLRRRRA